MAEAVGVFDCARSAIKPAQPGDADENCGKHEATDAAFSCKAVSGFGRVRDGPCNIHAGLMTCSPEAALAARP